MHKIRKANASQYDSASSGLRFGSVLKDFSSLIDTISSILPDVYQPNQTINKVISWGGGVQSFWKNSAQKPRQ